MKMKEATQKSTLFGRVGVGVTAAGLRGGSGEQRRTVSHTEVVSRCF